MRPVLKPALRRLWRDPSTLQLGVDPRHAVVVSGVSSADRELLTLLDGSRESDAAIAEAGRLGQPVHRGQTLLELLSSAGVLDDAELGAPTNATSGRLTPDQLSLSLCHPRPGGAARAMASRQAATVEVLGAGRTGSTLAALLAAAGVGRVVVDDPALLRPADLAPGGVRAIGVHHRRGDAANAVVSTVRTAAAGGASHGSNRSLVVLAPTGSAFPPEWLVRVRRRAHLLVMVRETTASIGPLVVPGRSPCLRCLELARADRDPVWPVLAAQLVGETRPVEPCDVALSSAAASLTAMHVLAWLDDARFVSPLLGGTVELGLSELTLRRRTVLAHPECGCPAWEPEQHQAAS
ncbi:MAG TPA: TOMM precursor leader peptide-binding protein [Mycobacteriales bacterium]|nr:TOMM precursor leader peptide-binding protein [Mycobacteriales bacterium]